MSVWHLMYLVTSTPANLGENGSILCGFKSVYSHSTINMLALMYVEVASRKELNRFIRNLPLNFIHGETAGCFHSGTVTVTYLQ